MYKWIELDVLAMKMTLTIVHAYIDIPKFSRMCRVLYIVYIAIFNLNPQGKSN